MIRQIDPQMKKSREKLKAELLAKAEAEIEELLDWHEANERPTFSELEAIPLTGRSHQIRAILYGLGYPVVGDKIYGVDDRLFIRFINGTLDKHDKKRLRISRQALHSAELRITHPKTRNRLSFEALVPPDMKALILLH